MIHIHALSCARPTFKLPHLHVINTTGITNLRNKVQHINAAVLQLLCDFAYDCVKGLSHVTCRPYVFYLWYFIFGAALIKLLRGAGMAQLVARSL